MSRAAQASINTAALKHNLQVAADAAPKSKILAVIKANGYGHGIVTVAKALDQADAFGVASMEEALVLKQAAIQVPIVLLEGMFDEFEVNAMQQNHFQPVIHSHYQLDILDGMAEKNPFGIKMTVWLKIDTGMHRLGFAVEEFKSVYERLQDNRIVNEIILMTHLANADDENDKSTSAQVDLFKQTIDDADCQSSIANSAGVLAWPQSHVDFIRPGIMLYGVSPLANTTSKDKGLQPVMTLSSKLIAVKQCKKADAIGYGGDWQCPEDMPIGVVAIGYGDGYPRHAPAETPVLVNGQRVPLVGRVSMDMITVDLRRQPNARVGDDVVLWGKGLPVEEVAQLSQTIAYELLCGVTQRVKFVETS